MTKKMDWYNSGLAQNHRIKSIGILLNHDETLCRLLFKISSSLEIAEGKEFFKNSFKDVSAEEIVLFRAALDIWNSSGDILLWQCLWELDHLQVVQLVRAICHLRELQLEAIQGIMTDYLGPIS